MEKKDIASGIKNKTIEYAIIKDKWIEIRFFGGDEILTIEADYPFETGPTDLVIKFEKEYNGN